MMRISRPEVIKIYFRAGSRINIGDIKIIIHNNFNEFVIENILYFSSIRGHKFALKNAKTRGRINSDY